VSTTIRSVISEQAGEPFVGLAPEGGEVRKVGAILPHAARSPEMREPIGLLCVDQRIDGLPDELALRFATFG
jgi:hypothetical protein